MIKRQMYELKIVVYELEKSRNRNDNKFHFERKTRWIQLSIGVQILYCLHVCFRLLLLNRSKEIIKQDGIIKETFSVLVEIWPPVANAGTEIPVARQPSTFFGRWGCRGELSFFDSSGLIINKQTWWPIGVLKAHPLRYRVPRNCHTSVEQECRCKYSPLREHIWLLPSLEGLFATWIIISVYFYY